jgi:hypothetical protein
LNGPTTRPNFAACWPRFETWSLKKRTPHECLCATACGVRTST